MIFGGIHCQYHKKFVLALHSQQTSQDDSISIPIPGSWSWFHAKKTWREQIWHNIVLVKFYFMNISVTSKNWLWHIAMRGLHSWTVHKGQSNVQHFKSCQLARKQNGYSLGDIMNKDANTSISIIRPYNTHSRHFLMHYFSIIIVIWWNLIELSSLFTWLSQLRCKTNKFSHKNCMPSPSAIALYYLFCSIGV